MANNIKKNKAGYSYKYTDIAGINAFLEEVLGFEYYQYTQTEGEHDYIYTVPIRLEDGVELPPRRGCRIVLAPLQGKSNAAQEQGSAITYARRYSLLMAFGLATEDDDAQSQTKYSDIGTMKKDLLKAMEFHKVSTEAICKVFNVKSIDEMDERKIKNALANIDKINARAESEQTTKTTG